MNDSMEERLVRAFAAEVEMARHDLGTRPLTARPRRSARARVALGVAAGLALVLVAAGFATVTRLSESAAPREPTYDQMEAARWVTGNLKYLYQLAMYPTDAAAPSPQFLFTKRGLADAVGQDDLLRRAVAREVFVALDYALGPVCVLTSAPARVDMDITVDVERPVNVFDASRLNILQTLDPGPRHLRIVVVYDPATGHWLIDEWRGSPFDTKGAAQPTPVSSAGASCS
jgi:hypothetical protein